MQVQVSLTIEIGATASLTQMEEQIREAGQEAMREALKQAIRQWEKQHHMCPHCGQKQHRLEGTTRRVIATMFGRVAVPRRRFRCQGSGRRWCPANSLFSELKGGTISQPLQEAAMLAGCSWPYRAASSLLRRLSGAEISAEEIRLLTNRGGQQRAAQQQAEAERTCSTPAKEAAAAQQAEPPMLVGLDGGWVCSREQRGGPRQPPRQRHRLAQRRYVATFGPARQLGQQAKAAAQTLGGNPSRPVVVIADGANWIKKEQGQHFPQATCMLDWAHLWREVRYAIVVAARAKSLAPRERDYQLYLHRSWLWSGGVEQALQGLRTLGQGLDAEAREAITKAITYLEHQRAWIGSYEHWRKQGYPVGSGMIENVCTHISPRKKYPKERKRIFVRHSIQRTRTRAKVKEKIAMSLLLELLDYWRSSLWTLQGNRPE